MKKPIKSVLSLAKWFVGEISVAQYVVLTVQIVTAYILSAKFGVPLPVSILLSSVLGVVQIFSQTGSLRDGRKIDDISAALLVNMALLGGVLLLSRALLSVIFLGVDMQGDTLIPPIIFIFLLSGMLTYVASDKIQNAKNKTEKVDSSVFYIFIFCFVSTITFVADKYDVNRGGAFPKLRDTQVTFDMWSEAHVIGRLVRTEINGPLSNYTLMGWLPPAAGAEKSGNAGAAIRGTYDLFLTGTAEEKISAIDHANEKGKRYLSTVGFQGHIFSTVDGVGRLFLDDGEVRYTLLKNFCKFLYSIGLGLLGVMVVKLFGGWGLGAGLFSAFCGGVT